MKVNKHAIEVIDALGGTAEVARICKVRMPSVSDWKREGIPCARLMYLEVAFAAELQGIDLQAARNLKRNPGDIAEGVND